MRLVLLTLFLLGGCAHRPDTRADQTTARDEIKEEMKRERARQEQMDRDIMRDLPWREE